MTAEPAMRTVADVVQADLCIGCGLCSAVTGGGVAMTLNAGGGLRPQPADGFSAREEAAVMAACPGVVAEARPGSGPEADLIWGGYRTMVHGWAADQSVRHEAASGGVLTALACFMLESGAVESVLHVVLILCGPCTAVGF